MKDLIIVLLFLSLSLTIQAQGGKEILGIAKEDKSVSYYQEQSKIWSNETKSNPTNANAWLQYYNAERAYLQKTYPDKWLNHQHEILNMLSSIIQQSKNHIGSSFEYYLLEAKNRQHKESIGFLEKAFEIDPERTETYQGLLVHYHKTFNQAKLVEISKRMLDCNYYSIGNYSWNNNALMSIEEGGVFISNGDLDAMPKWVLQAGKQIRTDVLTISKWLMANETAYRKTVFDQLNIEPLGQDMSDFENPSAYVDALVGHIMKNTSRPVYMACGTDIKFLRESGLAQNMYIVGCVLKYSKKKFDNSSLTVRNFEYNYDLDYVKNSFQYHAENEIVRRQMNLTYIPGLAKVRDYFNDIGDKEKSNYYYELMQRIAKDSGRPAEIISWF